MAGWFVVVVDTIQGRRPRLHQNIFIFFELWLFICTSRLCIILTGNLPRPFYHRTAEKTQTLIRDGLLKLQQYAILLVGRRILYRKRISCNVRDDKVSIVSMIVRYKNSIMTAQIEYRNDATVHTKRRQNMYV